MADNNGGGRANHLSKDTDDHTSGTDQSRGICANPSQTSPSGRLTVSSGIAPTQTEPSTTSEPTSRDPGSSARNIAQPPGVDRSGSVVQVPYRHDRGTRVPFNKEVIELFENGPPTGKVLFENHNGLISWLRHHGHRVGKHNQHETVALVGNFLRHVHAFPDDFYGRLESPPDAVQRQMNASKRPVRRARKTSVRLQSSRATIRSTATGEEVEQDTPGHSTMASPQPSHSSTAQSPPNDTRESSSRERGGASEAYVPGSTAPSAEVSLCDDNGSPKPSKAPPAPSAAYPLVQGAYAPGAALQDEGQKATKDQEERKKTKRRAELHKGGDVDDSKSFKVTDPFNVVRPRCPNCGAVRCSENHSDEWCDCKCWGCDRSRRK